MPVVVVSTKVGFKRKLKSFTKRFSPKLACRKFPVFLLVIH